MLVGSDRPTDRQCHLLSCPGQLKRTQSKGAQRQNLQFVLHAFWSSPSMNGALHCSAFILCKLVPWCTGLLVFAVPDHFLQFNVSNKFLVIREDLLDVQMCDLFCVLQKCICFFLYHFLFAWIIVFKVFTSLTEDLFRYFYV